MTARASSPEFSCSSCRALVLHGDTAGRPSCSSCERLVCSECELLGRCLPCFVRERTQPAELEDDDERPLLVGAA